MPLHEDSRARPTAGHRLPRRQPRLAASPQVPAHRTRAVTDGQAPTAAPGGRRRLAVAATSVFLRRALVALAAEHRNLVLVALTGQRDALPTLMARHRPQILLADDAFASTIAALDAGNRAQRVLLVSHRHHAGAWPAWDPAGICCFFGIDASETAIHHALQRMADCPSIGSRGDAAACRSCPLKASLQPPALPLSPREREVFGLIGRCLGNREIAARLGCSVKTVEAHRENIKHKLALRTGLELTAGALAWCRGDPLDGCPSG